MAIIRTLKQTCSCGYVYEERRYYRERSCYSAYKAKVIKGDMKFRERYLYGIEDGYVRICPKCGAYLQQEICEKLQEQEENELLEEAHSSSEGKKLFIACSSSDEIPSEYLEDCKAYLRDIFHEREYHLVFGASIHGLMGKAYEQAMRNEREIDGVCPSAYQSDLLLLNHVNGTIVNTVGERVSSMIDKSDALIFLPGGIGTIHELFTAIETKRSGEHDKPIVIYNSCHFFDGLLAFLDKVYHESFTKRGVADCYHISYSSMDTLIYLDQVIT